jgi:hypothetical protein
MGVFELRREVMYPKPSCDWLLRLSHPIGQARLSRDGARAMNHFGSHSENIAHFNRHYLRAVG